MNNKLEVIGIDHGWSMMKTVTQVFVTGVKEITTTPALFGDVLEYDGKYYKIGTVRQEVKDTKVEDDSFYLLTLAAVAKELKKRGLSDAKVFLAVGLPLTRFGAERNNFIKYLTKNKRVDFRYENEAYHIEIDDVAVFPQCYAAVVDKIPTMAKKTLVVDIGSWTIDIMPVINKSPDESKCVTVPRGLITCMRSINEQCVRQLNGEVDETEIQNIMRYGRSDIDDESVAMGLTAKQLVFSIASVIVGGGIVLLLYRYIGLTGSAYVAIPCVAPIALGGFYSFNGMNFYEYMGKKLHFMFGNKALTYVSTEGEPIIKAFEMEQNGQVKKKGKKLNQRLQHLSRQ